ncbi:MAG: 50S ribosomal protein L23 [Cyanobacteria bacterium J06607_15]
MTTKDKTKLNERELADLILKPIITEKGTIQMELGKYVFDVLPKATKPDIRAAVESLFDVTVVKVNTLKLPRKKRRVGRFEGYKAQYKRAIVTLKEGDSIALFPDV